MALEETPEAIAADVAAVARLESVPPLLEVLCRQTGMGFAAVARVTDSSWTACAVLDKIGFGLKPGGQLPIESTLCRESRHALRPIVIDDASLDAVYRDHHTPRIYGIRSYISVPIVLGDDTYFGNLCAIDPNPANVSRPESIASFTAFAELIARQLDSSRRLDAAQAALTDARVAGELREQFIAVLGHDLRNPLSAVSNIAQLMMRGGAKIDVPAYGQRLASSARRMSELIDNVLDLTRSRLGGGIGVDIKPQPDLGTALLDVVGEIRLATEGREIVAAIDIPEPVVCDRGRMQQLLSNLLSNAIQHGDSDRAVSVSASMDGQDLVIAVTNSGLPIAAADLPKIFEPFWRPATHDARASGLGLGLHICKQIVAAHRGDIRVTSDAAGTRFTARIPSLPR